MSHFAFAVAALTVVLDVIGQIAFKLGLSQDDAPLVRRLLNSAILLGVAIYGVELVLWLLVLTLAPLSVAFPFAALAYCGVVLAGRLVLKERVSVRRWIGAGVVTAGVTLVCIGA